MTLRWSAYLLALSAAAALAWFGNEAENAAPADVVQATTRDARPVTAAAGTATATAGMHTAAAGTVTAASGKDTAASGTDTAAAGADTARRPQAQSGGARPTPQPVALRPRNSLWDAPAARAPARDLFAPTLPPPPAPVAAPPPPPPAPLQPPPLPYVYLGKRLDGDGWDVFLGRGEHTFIVREGATIEGAYRIDRIQPPRLEITYLPLGHPQTLAIGTAD